MALSRGRRGLESSIRGVRAGSVLARTNDFWQRWTMARLVSLVSALLLRNPKLLPATRA